MYRQRVRQGRTKQQSRPISQSQKITRLVHNPRHFHHDLLKCPISEFEKLDTARIIATKHLRVPFCR